MEIYILATVLAVLIIAAFCVLIVHGIRCYFVRKAKKMTQMELVDAQIKEWEAGWFHKLKYEIYSKEFKSRPRIIPYSDID